MERYSEYYEDDARRLAQMLASETNGQIEPFYKLHDFGGRILRPAIHF